MEGKKENAIQSEKLMQEVAVINMSFKKKKKERERENREENKSENLPKK